MKGSQLKRLQKLDKQVLDDRLDFFVCVKDEIYQECADILAARDELEEYIIRHGQEPPRFYQYGEDEHTRRWLWVLHVDKQAHRLYKRLAELLDREAEIRGAQREQNAREKVIENWEWYLGKPEREAKAAAEREERRRKQEEERQERERKWQEERAARLSQTDEREPHGGYQNQWSR